MWLAFIPSLLGGQDPICTRDCKGLVQHDARPNGHRARGVDALETTKQSNICNQILGRDPLEVDCKQGYKEGYFFFAAGFVFFWFLVLCFPVSDFLLFCFSAFLLSCFPVSFIFCFSASLLFVLLCFSASLLFCFSAFPASLLFCFWLFLLLCFSASLFSLLCFCTSVPFYFYYIFYCFFSSVMCFCCSTSCSFASLLSVFTVSLFFIFFCFILFCLYPKWKPRETLGETQRNLKEILIRHHS